ncbi:hypothetical protein [Cellulomonas sp. URHD0024]|uniref:hypothetical protein n=1 Tax=Cellulomonas sp. URHD0024 TaxID=1302620 RepID=UPI00040EEB7C|nr:hypothetical protein [Cellulomonas sp. URHD0024]
MSTTSKKSRKGLAIGLAILGIAGLSLASASALNLGGTAQLQAGVKDLTGCQPAATPVVVGFTPPSIPVGGSAYTSTTLTLSGIDALCSAPVAAKYKVSLLSSTNALLGTEFSGTLAGTSLSLTLTAAQTPDVISRVAVTFYN